MLSQRAYLTLYNYDRGTALIGAQPKHFSVTELPLVQDIKAWATHPDAARPDWTLAALVALRHSLVRIRYWVELRFNTDPAMFSRTHCKP